MKNKYLLSISETSKIFGIGRDKLYQLVKSEPDIPIIKIGEYIKINAPMFEKWLNDCVTQGREL